MANAAKTGGISIPKATGVSIPKPGKIPTPSVPTPRSNPTGYHMQPRGFPKVTPPRVKSQNTRLYAKSGKNALSDPTSLASGGGFGSTGLTGET